MSLYRTESHYELVLLVQAEQFREDALEDKATVEAIIDSRWKKAKEVTDGVG